VKELIKKLREIGKKFGRKKIQKFEEVEAKKVIFPAEKVGNK